MGSNALAFKEWATNESVCQSAPVEQLRNIRMGVDGDDYVHSLLFAGQHEPLLSALGGLPFSLHKRVDDDLQSFRDAGIEPIFVFNGLDLACKDKASVLRESRKAEGTLKGAWSVYDEGNSDETVKAFGRLSLYRSEHIVRSLQVYLHKQGAYTQTAPYSAAAQLVYMEHEGFVDSIFGSASCLVFGAAKVVISFDWKEKTFTWVPLDKCLNKLALTRDQFFNVCLLSGSSILPAYPEVDTEAPASRVQAARNVLSRVAFDVHGLLHDPKDEHYRELFQKARFILRHPVIMMADGKVEPLNWESAPGDAHEFSGQKLPEEIYGYLSYGVIGPRVLNWRTRMEILETPPLDGGDSEAYKKLVQEKLRPLRAKALALMTQSLHRYYQSKDVPLVCWWDAGSKTPLNIAEVVESSKVADSWHVKAETMPSLSDAPSTPLFYGIASLADDAEAKKTVTPRTSGASPQLRKLNELLTNTIWRFLEDRGYINPDHTLSAWGKALKASFDRATKIGLMAQGVADSEIEEAIFIAFEMLRLDVLSSKQMFPFPLYSGAPMRGSEEDKAHTLLVSRVACMGAFHHGAIGYTGPLSRHLLAYHQMAAAVRGALRDLVEMHACKMLLSGAADRSLTKAEYGDLGASLPFLNEPDIGLALVVKSHLDEQTRPAGERTDVGKWFIYASDIPGDLEKSWEMWDSFNAGVQAAEDKTISTETKEMFKSTDEWLAQKRADGHVPNGTT